MSNVEKVNKVIIDQLGVAPDEIKAESRIVEDLGADSLDVVELVMLLEEEFGTEIPDESAEGLTTVQSIYDYVEQI